MSQIEERLAELKEQATEQLKKCGVSKIDEPLLDTLVGRLRLIANNKDAIYVSGTDPSELDTVRRNFVVKKLNINDKDKAMTAIHSAADKMKGIKFKNRAAFYYMVQKELS